MGRPSLGEKVARALSTTQNLQKNGGCRGDEMGAVDCECAGRSLTNHSV